MSKIINTRLRLKKDTSANWELNNPVLLDGEKIIVITNAGEVREKIGDGTKTYTQLPFTDEPLRTLISDKVDKVSGKGLSTNDYTTAEKNKLAGIAEGANKYTHPSTHAASMITQDSTHRFVTDAEKSEWNSKPSTSVASSTANGLMSKDDKIKLDGIATGANKYTHPTYISKTSGLYKITVDGTGHVSAATAVAKSDITGLGIPAQDTTYGVATTSSNGLMSSDDKTKLDGIAAGANNYTHPSSHAATMITQDSTHRFVTDSEKSTWNAKASTAVATTDANGLMSSTDKTKLDGIATGANNYSHPTYTTKASGLYKVTVDGTGHVSAATLASKSDITALGIPGQDTTYSDMTGATTSAAGTHGLVPAPEKGAANRYLRSDGAWVVPPNDNTTYGPATTTSNGLMSSTDKTKLDGIAAGANNYTHPSSHAATMITQDSTHRFVTDTEKSTWNAKASTAVATTNANGLMSSDDKSKLDGIAANANNYSHPTYTAKTSGLYKITVDGTGHVSGTVAVTKSDITGLGIPGQDTTYSVATTTANGLMSSDDKTKLDGIATGANNYSHPTYTSRSAGFYKVTVDGTGHVSAVTSVAKSDITALGIPGQDTTYGVATTDANGLMSSTDKTKLDGIATGANKTTVDSALSSTSTNPVQNKVINTALNGKSNTGHTHTKSEITDFPTSLKNPTALTIQLNGTSQGAYDGSTAKTVNITAASVGAATSGHTHTAAAIGADPAGSANTALTNAKSYTDTKIADLINSAPETLDTLGEIATAMTEHQDVVAALQEAVGTKANASDLTSHTGNTTVHITANERTAWNAKASTAVATTSTNGLMSSSDKSKLDGIAANANNYSHPSSHAATMITEDSTHRFVTDAEKSTWNAKASTAVATTSANGLMSKDMVTKLNGIATNANNYSHPTYTSRSAGLYKITVDGTGHVSAVTAVAKADITGLGIPAKDTTYSAMTGASATAAGTTGLVPAPAKGAANRYLRSDGTWQVPPDTNTTYKVATTSANGLMSSTDKSNLTTLLSDVATLKSQVSAMQTKLQSAVFYE